MLALVLLRFLSGSLLAAMGDACGGIFSYSHGFLAESRWNYLLAAGIATAFLLQLAFLIGGGTRLLRVTHGHKKRKHTGSVFCPALSSIVSGAWADRTFLTLSPDLEAQTVGLFRPRILVSRGLVESLSGEELMAVVSHEEAHRSGRDNIIVALAKSVSLTLFYIPGQRMAFREMCFSLEKAADRKAADAVGGPILVAQALAGIAKAGQQQSHAFKPALAVAVSGSGDLTGRLEELISLSKPSRSGWRRLGLFLALAATSMAFFSASALAVTGSDQRGAFICFTEHQQSAGPDGICTLDHEEHAAP